MLKRHCRNLGYVGGLTTALLIWAKSSLIVFFSSLGILMTFDDQALFPILFLFFVIIFAALFQSLLHHGKIGPIVLTKIGLAMYVISMSFFKTQLGIYGGILLIIIAAFWDLYESQ